MIILKNYQQEAVDGLVKDTYSLLKRAGARQKMVFKAPTGAGKTVTMAAYLNRLCEELPDITDVPKRKVAFIWIAPNQLHLQSFTSLKNYFAELRSIKPIQFEDITDNRLQTNEVLFLNWQSINKEKNLFIRENESDKTLTSYINGSRLHDTEIILILDEAHLFATKGKAAKTLLQQIYAKIEIDVSATPEYTSEYGYTIKRHDVVEAEMIKQSVVLNPKLDAHTQHGESLNHVLMEQALKKRSQLAQAYQNAGCDINPLLLIQLPNDNKSESVLDKKIRDEVIAYMTAKGITTDNNRLAIWLSDTKTNLVNIEDNNSMVDVLLFKQAISLGWDCPRAAVLLIFREIQQETFTIQTVGRILRMPEQKHYPEAILNYGYVYTDLSKDRIQIVKDDMDYIVQNKAIRIPEYNAVKLPSYYINSRITRNRLGSKFRKCFYEAAEEFFDLTQDTEKAGTKGLFLYNAEKMQQKFIELDVSNIEIPIPRDVEFENVIGITRASSMEQFAKTQNELSILFRKFCRNHVGHYAKVESTPVLEMAMILFFEEYVGIDEYKSIKIILHKQNAPRFIDVIDKALVKHEKLLQQKAASASKKIIESSWDVPPERIFNEYYEERPSEHHALDPFYESKSASSPEKRFVEFLTKNKDHIDWWYKNGDKNKEDFAVTYEDRNGIVRGFYVDFVIKLKNDTIALFDTKTPDSDAEFCNKHNALIDYIAKQSKPGKKLIGGVIVPKAADVWKYCDNKISNAKDTTGWVSFDPAILANS
ncbi:MAG: DEAD/DEAH box helicase [Bacteroidota bacterium]